MKGIKEYIKEGVEKKYVIVKRDAKTFTAYHGTFKKLYKRFQLSLEIGKKESPLVCKKEHTPKTIKSLIVALNKNAYETRRYQTSYTLGNDEDLTFYKVVEC